MLHCPVPSTANRCCPLSTQDTASRGWSHSGGRVQSQEPSTTAPSPAPSSPPSMYTIVPWTPVTMVFLTFMNLYRYSLFSVLFEEHIVPCTQWCGDSACSAARPMTHQPSCMRIVWKWRADSADTGRLYLMWALHIWHFLINTCEIVYVVQTPSTLVLVFL